MVRLFCEILGAPILSPPHYLRIDAIMEITIGEIEMTKNEVSAAKAKREVMGKIKSAYDKAKVKGRVKTRVVAPPK